VINLLNRYFVPVYASNQNPWPFADSPQARAEVRRIYYDFIARKLGAADVHVYILKPDASSLAGLAVEVASDSQMLQNFLMKVVTQLGTEPGAPAFKPRPQSVPPQTKTGDLVLHLVARNMGVGSWSQFPAENWIVLDQPEWMRLLPSDAPRVGATWQLETGLTHKLLTRFYPPTEETTNHDRNRIDQATLQLTVTAFEQGIARARIEGKLRMKHALYPGKDHEDMVEATLFGFLDWDVAERHIQRFRLVTDRATYLGGEFSAGFNSVSAETMEALAR
jgi:hypothetical protein